MKQPKVSEVSNDVKVAYLYCPEGKDYDYDQMLNLLSLKAGDTNIAEVYSDGWADMPDTMESLILDVPKYSHVYLLTLEGVSESELRALNAHAKLRCLLFDTGWVDSPNSENFKKLIAIKEAAEYYKELRSLNIRAGMKKTKKHVGNVPFGHRRLEDGSIEEIPEEMALAKSIAEMYRAGFPVMQISIKSEGRLTPRQIYGLMNYWGVKRG